MKRTCNSGVYIILNTINGYVYSGSTTDVQKRIWHHQSILRRGKHINPNLQKDWDKYGEDAFEFNVVCYCGNKNRLSYEQELIDKYTAMGCSYNMYPKAGSPLGSHHSEKTKEKQAQIKREYWETHDLLIGDKNPFYGKTHTKESLTLMSEKKKGQLIGNKHALGHHFSLTPEQLEKARNSWTPERREAVSVRAKQRYEKGEGLAIINNDKERIINLDWLHKLNVGSHRSEESRKKISDGIKKFHQNKKEKEDIGKSNDPK
jgi:group I intron endonuclease